MSYSDQATVEIPQPQRAPAPRSIPEQWIGPAFDPDLARDELLHELFEATADRRGDATAVVCGTQRRSYREIERQSNRLAKLLRSRGARPGDFIAFILPRSADVYVTLLAILKTGAAYVPLDPEYPADRVSYILADCGAKILVTTSELAAKHSAVDAAVIRLDADQAQIAACPEQRLTRAETGAITTDLCYVIYTSGSTGRPKGVQIEHRSACNLVRAEGRIFNLRPDDRVYQGFSIAFDASVEEVWLAFFSGATLVAATPEMVHAGPELSRMLSSAGVTVLSCVPTLISMLHEDIPSVRLLIVGGEACPAHLVKRWCTPSRRMVNTYGPTEATVIATYGDLSPGKPVTIGIPVPNYRVYLLDQDQKPVGRGATGEICLGGIGLARGYVGKLELTAEKFIADPFNDPATRGRLYRTGDLGRYTDDGEIEFLGRVDTQVKIRGFRVELSEIESAIMQCRGVQSTVVAMRANAAGVQQLVAYVVPHAKCVINKDAIRAVLSDRLPAYMVPALIEEIRELPTLPSGKVDRKSLPEPRARSRAIRPAEQPRKPLEKKIAAAWETLFAPLPVGINDDFFVDLGGHSLLAASMVSQLRHDPDLADLSVLDVYAHPTVHALAAGLEARRKHICQSQPKLPAGTPARKSWYRACVAGQLIGLYFILAFYSSQWLAPYMVYSWTMEHGYKLGIAIGAALGILLLVYPGMFVISIAAKWLLLGRVRAGSYPLWGWFYLRWWFVKRLLAAVPTELIAGTPLLNIYYRLMGAKIGRNVHLSSDCLGAFDLVSIGDESSIGQESALLGYLTEDGCLRLGRIDIGRRCFVGGRCIIQPDVCMADDSRLGDLSLLTPGTVVESGMEWVGSPAHPLPRSGAPVDAQIEQTSRLRRIWFGILHTIAAVLVPVTFLAAIAPGMALLTSLNRPWTYLASPLAAIMFIVALCLETIVLKWLLLGRMKPGTYSTHSWFYIRKWFFDQLMDESLELLGPLYATLYFNLWYRLLGAKMGASAEISTAAGTSPDLLEIGAESFIADAVALGPAHVDRGRITIASTRIGSRAFIGNSALIPTGSVIGDNTLIGVLSAPPLTSPGASASDTSWLGSPAIFLPQRQHSTQFDEHSTYKPTRGLYILRLFIEFFRITLPATFFILLSSMLITTVIILDDHMDNGPLALVFPLVYAAYGVFAALIVVAAKWILMGRYRPAEKPLWSGFVWRTELLTALHEHLADPFLVELLQGTPFVCWFFRLLGSKIGKRVYMETTCLTEFDLIDIGDDAILDDDCTVQTHLFEDRVMKMSHIRIGRDCSVGVGSIVLYDTEMADGSALGDLSLLMKGESLPAGSRWQGTPAQVRPGLVQVSRNAALATPSIGKPANPHRPAFRSRSSRRSFVPAQHIMH